MKLLNSRQCLTCGLLFWLLHGAPQCLSAAVLQDSLPASSARYGAIKVQRIRFKNAPLFNQANEALARRDDAKAILAFHKILENDPGNNQARLALITLYERQKQYRAGIALCDEIVKDYPEFIAAYRSKGYLAMKDGQYNLAAASWEEELKRLPANDVTRRRAVLLALGQAYGRATRYRDAERVYAEALALACDSDTALSYFLTFKGSHEPERGRIVPEPLPYGSSSSLLQRTIIYELALLDRRIGRTRDYSRRMETLIDMETDGRRFFEYGFALYDAGNYKLSLQALEKAFNLSGNDRTKYAAGLFIAGIYLQQNQPAGARIWLDKIKPAAGSDARWLLAMARADFLDGNFRASILRLIYLPNQSSSVKLLIGLTFLKEGMPGPALEILNAIDDPSALAPEDQLSLYRNRAYLNFDQDNYVEAENDAETAFMIEAAPDTALVHLKAYACQKDYEIVETNALLMLNPVASGLLLNSNEQAQVNLILGRCHYQQKQYDQAVTNLTQALEQDRTLAEGYYLRGLAFHALGKSQAATNDYQKCLLLDTNPPANFWGDLGQAAGAQKDYKKGTAALEKSLEYHSVDVDSLANQGYQFMKWNHNREAKQDFKRAIDLYSDLTPRGPTNETPAYRRGETAMKQEYTKLDKVFGMQAYLSHTDYGLATNAGISTVAGALPSQYGMELSLRPPFIGFRDEKVFDVFGDLFGNFKNNTWSPDPDSYQGMLGVRYKPLAKVNYNMSFARLMKIGDNSENNWLWRNMASWERGEKPAADKSTGFNVKLFGDAGYYFEQRSRWYGYLDGRASPTFKFCQNTLLMLPQLMGVIRGENNDDTDFNSYALAGIGGTLRFFEPERRYTIDRVYIDVFLFYTAGRFLSTPAGLDGPSFNGLMFGLNLVK